MPDINIEEVIYEMCKDYGEGELSYCAIDPQYDNTLPSKGIYNEYIYYVPETELYYRFYIEDGVPVAEPDIRVFEHVCVGLERKILDP